MKAVFIVAALLVASASALPRQRRQLVDTCTNAITGAQCVSGSCPSGYVVDSSKSCGIAGSQKCCVKASTTSAPKPTRPTPPNTCGLNQYSDNRFVQPYVVGGIDADEHEYPWQVSMQKNSHTCGASVISKRWILCAAHCFSTTDPSAWKIVVGEHSLKTSSGREVIYKAQKVIKHSGYSSSQSNLNDIALVQTTTEIEFNQFVQPICVAPTGYDKLEGKSAVATGWGTTSEGGNIATILQEVTVPVITNTECSRAYPTEKIYDTTICAGNLTNGGIDTCQGDSGGPLVHRHSNGSYVQVGITSWGIGCARKGKPGVYTRVSEYWDWIWANAV